MLIDRRCDHLDWYVAEEAPLDVTVRIDVPTEDTLIVDAEVGRRAVGGGLLPADCGDAN